LNRNLWLLALCQGLFLTNNVAFIAINGLAGVSVLAMMAFTSFASEALVSTQGWAALNWGLLVPVTLTAATLAWLAARSRAAPG
jgi:hypothetical protein